MPLVRKLDRGLCGSSLPLLFVAGLRRVLFTSGEGRMILLHGFIKKSQKTPKDDLELAKTRMRLLQ